MSAAPLWALDIVQKPSESSLLTVPITSRAIHGRMGRNVFGYRDAHHKSPGSLAPLVYDVDDRKLVVNASEAETVRHIFHRYAEIKSVRALKEELDADGIVSKARRDRFGNAKGGVLIARGALYLMLQNRIYRGEIVHKDTAYPGLRDTIVEEPLWNTVQTALAENRVERVVRSKAADPSLLAGLVYDDNAERMSPTHANKTRRGVGGAAAPKQTSTRYRYYVSQSLIKRGRPTASASACRVPAADLETIVDDEIVKLMRDEAFIHEVAGDVSIAQLKALINQASVFARCWPDRPLPQRRAMLTALLERVIVHPDTIVMAVRLDAIPLVTSPALDIRRLPRRIDGLNRPGFVGGCFV